MLHATLRLAPVLLWVLLPAAAGAVFAPGTNARTLTHDAVLRSYNVYAPASYDGQSAVPLVVDIHGLSSTAQQQQGLSGWQAKADEIGFLVAYPEGLDNSWNAGVCCGQSMADDVDDVGFLTAVVTAIEAEGNVDPDRVYATGLSNGGAMTQRLACEAADVFAAAAPLAFPVPFADFATACQPTREIPVLLSMGLTDVLVPYAGGTFAGAVESYQAWRAKNSCVGGAQEDLQIGGSDCTLDTACANDTQVGLCSVRGTAFTEPPLDAFSGHILYLNQDGIVFADLIWDFFTTGSLGTTPAAVPAMGGAGWLGLLAGVLGVALALRRRR